tara:strand:+ start:496 stop:2619 length:2124 start_codon:yes stop_codon:yes gene_type:complete
MKKLKKYFILTISIAFLFSAFFNISSIEAGGAKNNTTIENNIFPYGIGLSSQPFFEDLEVNYEKWKNNLIAPGTGKSPKETILNFYSLMSLAGDIENQVYYYGKKKPGLFWDKETKKKIKKGETYFIKAAHTLDGSSFAKSVREHLSDEAAVELKHIFDYIFNSTKKEINLPDYKDLKRLSDYEQKEWKLPNSKISLIRSDGKDGFVSGQYYFSNYTVRNIRYTFKKIEYEAESLPKNKYTTPNFYLDFIHTPGLLVPPKWYASLPDKVHEIFEIEIIGNQTIFQIFFALITIILYGIVIIKTFNATRKLNISVKSDYLRIYYAFIPIPLTKLSELFIDKFLNFTGNTLIFFTFIFEVLLYLSVAIFTIFLFEFIGKNFFDRLQKVSSTRSGNKYVNLLRLRTFTRPICRVLSTVICIVLIYNLLLSLGVPTNAVLAFSAVPGLALGLGASKLLGNLISGLIMQADQHLNVGNFCKVGNTLGYVKRVGLRSIDIQSFEGCVTIPNAFAEGTNVVNYTSLEDDLIKQSLNLKIDIDKPFSPWQKKELIRFCQKFLNEDKFFSNPIVSIEKEGDKTTLVIFSLILNKDWREYLRLRDRLTLKTSEIISQVSLSRFVVGVSYNTTSQQLAEIPELIREIVNEIDNLEYDSCKFEEINQFSYDFVVCVIGELKTYSNFLKAYDNLNKSLIAKFAEKNINIPFPTTTFDQKN